MSLANESLVWRYPIPLKTNIASLSRIQIRYLVFSEASASFSYMTINLGAWSSLHRNLAGQKSQRASHKPHMSRRSHFSTTHHTANSTCFCSQCEPYYTYTKLFFATKTHPNVGFFLDMHSMQKLIWAHKKFSSKKEKNRTSRPAARNSFWGSPIPHPIRPLYLPLRYVIYKLETDMRTVN